MSYPRNPLQLKSRYGDVHKLVPVDDADEKAYRLESAFDWMPIGITYDKDENGNRKILAVDPDGGPYITEGFVVKGHVVESIYETPNGQILLDLVKK